MKLVSSHAVFLFAMAGAGFLSGILNPLYFGIRGAILGLALGFGIAAVNPWTRRFATAERESWHILSIGVLVGLLAAIALWVMDSAVSTGVYREFGFRETMSPPFIAMASVAYCAFFLLAYRAHHQNRGVKWLWLLLAMVASSMVRSIGMGSLQVWMFVMPLGTLPFTILILLAVIGLDPAWMEERWERWSGGDPTGRLQSEPPSS